MNTGQKVFIYLVTGAMFASVIALTIMAIVDGNSNNSTSSPAPTVPDFSELKIEDIREGDGEELELGKTITVNYRLTLSDGTPVPGNDTFVSGSPATFMFARGSLIEGWTNGLVGMKAGGLRKLEVPSVQGYGPIGNPPNIPGGAGLIFEVELLEIDSE